MILPVTINANRGPAPLVGVMKQHEPCRYCQSDQPIGLRLPVRVSGTDRLTEHVFDKF